MAEVVDFKLLAGSIENPYLEEWKASGRTLELSGTVVAADRTVTVEGWSDFQKAISTFAGIGDLRLTATRKGARS